MPVLKNSVSTLDCDRGTMDCDRKDTAPVHEDDISAPKFRLPDGQLHLNIILSLAPNQHHQHFPNHSRSRL